MKYVILVGDSMGDYPMPELGGKTPLEAKAKTPSMDELARRGELGCARTVPPGKAPGSDIANLPSWAMTRCATTPAGRRSRPPAWA